MFWKSSLLSPGLVGVVLALKVPQLAVRKQNLGSAVQCLTTIDSLHQTQTQPTIQVRKQHLGSAIQSLTTIASLHQTQPTIQVLLSSR